MKRAVFFPSAVLVAVLAFSLWNSAAMAQDVHRWQGQLHQAELLLPDEDWAGITALLHESYQDWCSRQTYLHIVTEHDAVDDAEAMYRRAMAFATAQEPSELRAELSDLSDQLRLLAEMEEFSIRNVL